MKEVTKEELHKAIKEAKKLARELAEKYGTDPRYRFSNGRMVCSYRDWYFFGMKDEYADWEGILYKIYPKKGTTLYHYMDCLCSDAKPNTVALCYATVREGNKYRFYISRHKVGQCPWKE